MDASQKPLLGKEDNLGYGTYEATENSQLQSAFFQTCDQITTNLFAITSTATNLKRSLRNIGTSLDNQQLRHRISEISRKGKDLVEETKWLVSSLQSMLNNDQQRHHRANQLQLNFQVTVTHFSEIQNKVVDVIRKVRLPPDIVASELDESISQALAEHDTLQQATEQMENKAHMLKMREQRVLELEADIVNINQIMKDLSVMTESQRETVDTIETNVEAAHDTVEAANVELRTAVAYQRKYQQKICILVLILIFVLGTVGIVLWLHFTTPS